MSITIVRTDNRVDGHRVAAQRRRRLEGSVALITGAGRGVGQLVARSFADAGATVAVVTRSVGESAHTVELITATGGTATAAVADVTDPPPASQPPWPTCAIKSARSTCSSTTPGSSVPSGRCGNSTSTMNVNLRGLIVGTQLVIPDMVAAGRGRIINITSQAGVHRWPLASAYSVSKAAVVKLTENLALETRRHGITVFSVHPGLLPIGISETVAATTPTGPHQSTHPRLGPQRPHRGKWSRPNTRLRPTDPNRCRRRRRPHWPAPVRQNPIGS